MRSSSQLSGMSTASSSQSETGFFGQATKLVTSMLGGGKKPKPEVKSLQLAAAVAKKVCPIEELSHELYVNIIFCSNKGKPIKRHCASRRWR